MGRGGSMELVFQRFFSKAFFLKFLRCWVNLERFWEAKMEAQIDFGEVFLRCFFRMRFGIDFESFFGRPKHEK